MSGLQNVVESWKERIWKEGRGKKRMGGENRCTALSEKNGERKSLLASSIAQITVQNIHIDYATCFNSTQKGKKSLFF